MAETSLHDEALTTLDWALRQTDPLTRMMLIERALKLHRRAIEAVDDVPAYRRERADGDPPRRH